MKVMKFSPAVLAALWVQFQSATTLAMFFTNDEEARRPAAPEELRFAIQLPGCSGMALNGKLILTAGHCQLKDPIGKAPIDPTNRFRVKGIVEKSDRRGLDYQILEVEWESGRPPKDLKYIKALELGQNLLFGPEATATELFTVGFPQDKERRPYYAQGKAKKQDVFYRSPMSDVSLTPKELQEIKENPEIPPQVLSQFLSGIKAIDHLFFNIGTCKGNSGGPVFTSNELKLASMVTGGLLSELHQEGFYGNSLEDEVAWNWGPSMKALYDQSPLLQEMFPEGQNKYVNNDHALMADEKGAFDQLGQRYLDFKNDWQREWVGETGRTWKFLGHHLNRDQAQSACSGEYRLPTQKEIQEALKHGLGDKDRNPHWGENLMEFSGRTWINQEGLEPNDRVSLGEEFKQGPYVDLWQYAAGVHWGFYDVQHYATLCVK